MLIVPSSMSQTGLVGANTLTLREFAAIDSAIATAKPSERGKRVINDM
jgi:hypothetical protein